MKNMKTLLLIGLSAACLLAGCGSSSGDSSSADSSDDNIKTEAVDDVSGAVDTLTAAVDAFNANAGVSLQMMGTFSSTYNDNTSMIGISGLYQSNANDKETYMILSQSYTDGSYVDYHYMTDGTDYVGYYETGYSGSSEEETSSTTSSSDDSNYGAAILDEESFNQAIASGTMSIPFTADDVDSVNIETDEDTGSETYVFELTPEKGTDTAIWLMEAINFIDTSSTEIDFDNESVTCSARYSDDGSLSYLKFSLKTTMTAEEEDLVASYNIAYIPVECGDEVDVNLPDLDDYIEEAKAEQEAYEEYLASQEDASSASEISETSETE